MSYPGGHGHSSSSSPPSSDEGPSGPLYAHSPTTPHADSPLLQPNTPPSRSMSAGFISSPLNPNVIPRSNSRSQSSTAFTRLASDESQALGGGQRGSMLLYRLASDDDQPFVSPQHRFSAGAESLFSLDSKYPMTSRGMMVPYVYDPEMDDKETDQDDFINVPDEAPFTCSWRGLANVGLLVTLILALLTLFVFYPVWYFQTHNQFNLAIDGNIRINGTGQAPVLFQMPDLVDKDTPDSAKTRTGFDNEQYTLVFSDEFNTDGRTFYPGDDPFWEAVDLWYGATHDMEWYDPRQITTGGGNLHILLENTPNNGLQYRSGMLQSWNKFCFTNGYIEVNLTLPGPNDETKGYWPGVWTMGNLGRPGYGATTDGTWPYTYNSCDVGTYPNQTWANGTGPAAALDSSNSKAQYNNNLSWLTGQRLSACTCPGEDHPGPSVSQGRGAPEIDALEAEKNKYFDGAVVSQSAQFAPFTANYVYNNQTQDEWWIYDEGVSFANPYWGSAVQQAVSTLTTLPSDIFNGTGAQYQTFGFEYWTDPKNPTDGFITWQANGVQSWRMGATSVGPDQGPDGSGVGQRLIPEEPMSIILNLGISSSFQDVDLSTMTFPAELLIDYIRVYQRTDEPNIGCDPDAYPTMDYINQHSVAYSNPQLSVWTTAPDGSGYNATWPKNGQYEGGC